MGKIDKEKLLKEIRSLGYYEETQVIKTIKNFPEGQPINFDALLKEYEEKYSCKKTANCDNCTYPNKLYYTTICFVDFLKSKNLTVPKLVDIPVKKTWTLKKEYQEAFKDFDFSFNRVLSYESEPAARRIKYYDQHEESDYSQVPVGAYIVVKFKEFNRSKCGVVCQHYMDFFNIDTGDNHHSVPYNGDGVESIEILKMPENVK